MKKFSFFEPFWKTFYCPEIYRDIARNWSGIGLLHLLIIIVLSSLTFTFFIGVGAHQFAQTDLPYIAAQIPDITLKKGEANTPEARPYYIKDRQGNLLALIDTTGSLFPEKINPPLYVGKNEAILIKGKGQTQTYQLNGFSDMTITAGKVLHWGHLLAVTVPFALFPLLLFSFLILRLIQALILSLLACVLNSLWKCQLNYAALFRLTVFALLPSLLLDLIADIIQVRIFGSTLILFIIMAVYTFLAVYWNRPQLSQPAV